MNVASRPRLATEFADLALLSVRICGMLSKFKGQSLPWRLLSNPAMSLEQNARNTSAAKLAALSDSVLQSLADATGAPAGLGRPKVGG